uniref:Protein Vpu n=1 Tax=Human immunodeficiency virus type 1 TaxID=11676 RepID=A0MPN8_HV1|nr:vpu protein [Human immunodeficiency virus 1]
MNILVVGIAALVVAFILVVIVWTIVYCEYKKLKRQERIDKIINRIRERAEDSGNESEGDAEELAALGEMGYLVLRDIDDL